MTLTSLNRDSLLVGRRYLCHTFKGRRTLQRRKKKSEVCSSAPPYLRKCYSLPRSLNRPGSLSSAPVFCRFAEVQPHTLLTISQCHSHLLRDKPPLCCSSLIKPAPALPTSLCCVGTGPQDTQACLARCSTWLCNWDATTLFQLGSQLHPRETAVTSGPKPQDLAQAGGVLRN